MLPFLKERHEGSMSGAVDEKLMRTPDEGEEDFGMVDAIADDLMEAIHKKDKKLLKEALEAFVEHIQSQDEIQDQEVAQ